MSRPDLANISISPDKIVKTGAILGVSLAALGLAAHLLESPDNLHLNDVVYFREENEISVINPVDAMTIAQQLQEAGVISELEQCASELAIIQPFKTGQILDNPCDLKPAQSMHSMQNIPDITHVSEPVPSQSDNNWPVIAAGALLVAGAGLKIATSRRPKPKNIVQLSSRPSTFSIRSEPLAVRARQKYLTEKVWITKAAQPQEIVGGQSTIVVNYVQVKRNEIPEGWEECSPPVKYGSAELVNDI